MKLTTNLPWQPTLFVSSGLSQKKITHTHTRERQRERESSERDRHKGRQTEKQKKQNIQHNTKLRNRKKIAQRGLIYHTILNKCEKYNAVRGGTDSGQSICNCNCVSDSKNTGYVYYICKTITYGYATCWIISRTQTDYGWNNLPCVVLNPVSSVSLMRFVTD